jgi:hypothetical protein
MNRRLFRRCQPVASAAAMVMARQLLREIPAAGAAPEAAGTAAGAISTPWIDQIMTMQVSAAPTGVATVGLYLLKLRFTPQHGLVGGGSMTLAVSVDAATGALHGQARGALEAGSEHPFTFSADATGALHSTGLGGSVRVGAVRGQAFVSFPPPAIGSYLAPFSASFSVDTSWSGEGQFSVGNSSYPCVVSPAGDAD